MSDPKKHVPLANLDAMTVSCADELVKAGVDGMQYNEAMNSLRWGLQETLRLIGRTDMYALPVTQWWHTKDARKVLRDQLHEADDALLDDLATHCLAHMSSQLPDGLTETMAAFLYVRAALADTMEFCGVTVVARREPLSLLGTPASARIVTVPTMEVFINGLAEAVSAFDDWAVRHVDRSLPEGSRILADHVCYKCGSKQEFEALRAMFERDDSCVYQSIISKRRIAVIKLPRPASTWLGAVRWLELSDQKPDGSQTSGFDHFEIYQQGRTAEQLAVRLGAQGVLLTCETRPHHTTWDGRINDRLKIRLEDEPLVEKIKREEFK